MDLSLELDTRETNFASINESVFQKLFPNEKKFGIANLIHNNTTFIVSVIPDKSVTSHTVIRMSRELARCWSFPIAQGTSIVITPFAGIVDQKPNKPVVVTPASVDDWEVVETAASFLEENLLLQLNLIVPGQSFPVWISRGQKHVIFKADIENNQNIRDPIVLSRDSEIAVAPMTRKNLNISQNQRRGYMHVRVVDEGFPVSIPELGGVGMICNTFDFSENFSPNSGCLVTVRDRPDILTIIACDSSLVDPGIVLVSPLMRDKYLLTSGERIVIEEQTTEIGNNVLVPKSIHLHVPNGFENKKQWTKKFFSYIERSGCIILPQGGWVHIDGVYCMVHFDLPNRNSAALLSSQTLSSVDILVDKLVVEESEESRIPKPFLKYIPASVVEKGIVKNRNHLKRLYLEEKTGEHKILPSFQPMVDHMHAYLESSLSHADVSLPFAGSGIILGSSSGSGKTTVARKIMDQFSPIIDYAIIDCSLLSSPSLFRLEEVKATISGIIRYALETPPYGIVFDNIDDLIPPEIDGDMDSLNEKFGASGETFIRTVKRGKILTAYLNDLLVRLNPSRSMVLLATAKRDSKSLSRLFYHCEKLPAKLTRFDREVLLEGAIIPMNVDYSNYSISELVEIRKTGTDNREIRRKLLANNLSENRLCSARKYENTKLGGLTRQIETLIDAITLPLNFPFLYPPSISPATGAFVIGPSGCGKSALVDKIIRETGLPVEIVRGPDLLDKYIGASEQGVRRVFEKAASIAPCIVVFDAIEALCPRRGSEGTGVTDRVVNQMLCYLDGVEKLEQVFVVAISSRPDMVDPALIRSGRLDITVICDVPNETERREIIEAIWSEFLPESVLTETMVSELSTHLADGCTGADIRAAFVNAKIDNPEVDFESVLKNFALIKPSLSPKERDMYTRILDRFRSRDGAKNAPSVDVGTKSMLH